MYVSVVSCYNFNVTETILLVIVALVGVGWVVIAAVLVVLAANLIPRLKQLKEVIDRAERLLRQADETQLVSELSAVLDNTRSTVSEIRARIEEVSPVIERLPALTDEISGTVSNLRSISERFKDEVPMESLKEILQKLGQLLDQLKDAAEGLDEMLSTAKDTRDQVAESISQTKGKVDDAISLIGGVAAGIKAGLRSLGDRENRGKGSF